MMHEGRIAMSEETASFQERIALLMARVFALVRACPVGRVTTYGWLAKAVGYPRGARMAGWFMNESVPGVPAQRVINSKGELSGSWAFGTPERMRSLLESEGVTFLADGRVDLKRYGWDPSRDLSEEERERILTEAAAESLTVSKKLLFLLSQDPASPFRTSSSEGKASAQ
jgi:methylated-DNA-protein-cysteine methyltransferase related protein